MEYYYKHEGGEFFQYKGKWWVDDGFSYKMYDELPPDLMDESEMVRLRGENIESMVERFKGKKIILSGRVWYYFDDEHVFEEYHQKNLEDFLGEVFHYLSGIPQRLNIFERYYFTHEKNIRFD